MHRKLRKILFIWIQLQYREVLFQMNIFITTEKLHYATVAKIVFRIALFF